MKTVLRSTLFATMSVFLITACGDKDEPATQETIVELPAPEIEEAMCGERLNTCTSGQPAEGTTGTIDDKEGTNNWICKTENAKGGIGLNSCETPKAIPDVNEEDIVTEVEEAGPETAEEEVKSPDSDDTEMTNTTSYETEFRAGIVSARTNIGMILADGAWKTLKSIDTSSCVSSEPGNYRLCTNNKVRTEPGLEEARFHFIVWTADSYQSYYIK